LVFWEITMRMFGFALAWPRIGRRAAGFGDTNEQATGKDSTGETPVAPFS